MNLFDLLLSDYDFLENTVELKKESVPKRTKELDRSILDGITWTFKYDSDFLYIKKFKSRSFFKVDIKKCLNADKNSIVKAFNNAVSDIYICSFYTINLFARLVKENLNLIY
ncbi:MAG: hypothetical protein R3Y64_09540 [Peptostreptococcaceae bacterium]